MSDVVMKSFLTGAAILSSAGPLAIFLLLPLAWDHAMDGELVRAAGWTVVGVGNAAIFGALVYGAIDTAYRAGVKQGERQAKHDALVLSREL